MVNLVPNQISNSDPSQCLAGVRVLLVEDEPDIADLLIFVLETAGAEVRSFRDAETALAFIELVQPNILLSNVRLPLENGDWLIRQVRRHSCLALRHLPAIAITSYTRNVSKFQALDAGFDRFLVKFEHSVVDEIVHLLSARL